MKTLYDLLGALPDDDAEDLRSAFRKAAKGAHPDLNPSDPDAALRFRQIVRAHEILSDDEQRAVYDHLLDLGHIEQEQAARRAATLVIHKLASAVMAFAGLAVATAGGYLLFMHISAASVPSVSEAENVRAAEEPRAADVLREAVRYENGSASDLAAAAARSLREQGLAAFRNGDVNGAIANLDQAIQLNPQFAAAYIDRNVIFYRLRKFDRAFAEAAPARPTDKPAEKKIVLAPKPQVDRQISWLFPHPQQAAEQDESRQESPLFSRQR